MREVFDYILGSASWNCPSAIHPQVTSNSLVASPNHCSILFHTDQRSSRRNFQDLKTASEMRVSISLAVFWKPSCKRTRVGIFNFDGSHRYRFYFRCSNELRLVFINETNHTSEGLKRLARGESTEFTGAAAERGLIIALWINARSLDSSLLRHSEPASIVN